MHSTETAPGLSIVLPYSAYARRAWLVAFWLVASAAAGALTGPLLWKAPFSQRIIWGTAAAVIVALPGLLRPRIAVLPLRAWNRLADLFARGATVALSGICFYVVFPVVGRVGSSVRLVPPAPGESLWTPWPGGGVGFDPSGMVAGQSGRGWLDGFAAWARLPRNRWAWALWPFLLALSSLETTRDVETPPPGIYTLY